MDVEESEVRWMKKGEKGMEKRDRGRVNHRGVTI